jgi:hypothetical protein
MRGMNKEGFISLQPVSWECSHGIMAPTEEEMSSLLWMLVFVGCAVLCVNKDSGSNTVQLSNAARL